MTNNNSSKYVDIPAIVQVIGSVYNKPELLDNEKYTFCNEDFYDDFHQTIFGTIFNLRKLGAEKIEVSEIENYLEQRPKRLAIYKANKGAEYILNCEKIANLEAFDYYYQRVKKMTLMRGYNKYAGLDLSWLYDPNNLFDIKKKQKQEDWLDNSSLEDIANIIDDKINEIRSSFVNNSTKEAINMGQGAEELLEQLKEQPEMGYPLYGDYINTLTRGARLGKFYLRSAATGVGKSRSMIADTCYIGCNLMYNNYQRQWVSTGKAQSVLYISTEQDIDEIQTMALSFLAGVEEDHILENHYEEGEYERCLKAAQMLKDSQIKFLDMPDFSLQDIENNIKMSIRKSNTKYIFLDYLHTSMKILEEITKRSGGVKLREDNILFMISIRLKDIAKQYGVFIMSATQLNGNYEDADVYDQNLLRGAKSIADKIDAGMIMLDVTEKDLEALKPVLDTNGFEKPGIKISIYKNRRGRWKNVILWCKDERGMCRINPIFVTKYNYEIVPVSNVNVLVSE